MTRLLRVLQIAKHFDPDTGGIETVTRNISEMLLSENIQADVLCTEVAGPYVERDREYRVIRCKANAAFGNKRLSLRYVTEGWRLQKEYDCAIVHLPNPLGVAVALSWNKPVISLWHADIPQRAIRHLSAPFDRMLLRKSAAIIGPTPVHLDGSVHASLMGTQRVVIPYPFDRSTVPPPNGASAFAERLREFRRGRPMAISIGRLVPYKGFDVLIAAARSFGERLCCLVVGSGPLQEDLHAKVRSAGLQEHILFAGAVTSQELGEALANARFGCMPSVTAAEMYGMAQLECMAVGLPMVSTNIERSGVPYVNKHQVTGLIVEPSDPQALAAAMLRMAEDEDLWLRLSKGARESIAKDHEISRIARKYSQLLRRVAL